MFIRHFLKTQNIHFLTVIVTIILFFVITFFKENRCKTHAIENKNTTKNKMYKAKNI